MSEPRDYFQEIDLNLGPAVGGPINSPLDKRAMHYFGFGSNGQQLALNIAAALPVGTRVLFSWRYAQAPGIGPIPPGPQADGVLDPFGGPNAQVARYENSHDRSHVLVWIDGPIPAGQPVIVRVSAWAKI